MFDTAENAASAVAQSDFSSIAVTTVSSVGIDSVVTTEFPDTETSALSESAHDAVLTTHTARHIANVRRLKVMMTD
jgi:hypothetical protein